MHWTNIGLILVAGLDLGMALLIWLRNPRNKINISFALAIFFLALWTFGVGMFREATSTESAIFWVWVMNVGGILIIIPFLFFSIYYPYQNLKLPFFIKIIIFLSAIIILAILFMPEGWFYKKSLMINPPNNNYVNNKIGYSVFIIYFLFYVVWSYYNLFLKFFRSQGFTRIQLFYVLIGTGVISFFGTLFGAISPLFFNLKYFWIGPYFSLFLIFFLIYFVFYFKAR